MTADLAVIAREIGALTAVLATIDNLTDEQRVNRSLPILAELRTALGLDDE